MGIELQIKAAEECLHAALVGGQDTTPYRAELDRLRADLARQRALETQAEASAAQAARKAAEASIQRDAARIAAESAGRVQAFLAAFFIEDSQQ
ncbi:hypothetical protein CF70_021210 [Cupriavidus sp. SK-3]|uniref:hypothetical protein n=1 Tax=Cupriavidus sp. SK-3 TaxID=1470558 RepID=UPI000445C080|nr:hypothetical protein [Cupriavidus sp. SK-3]KDP84214.1 hypothetical protein CF70_021210 [Cupriavidus sp. SK-3]